MLLEARWYLQAPLNVELVGYSVSISSLNLWKEKKHILVFILQHQFID